MNKDLKLYFRLLGYIRPYWRVVVISIAAMMVSAALEPVLPALMQPLIDKSLIQRHGVSLWQVPVFIVLAFVLKGIADYVANVASQTVAQKTIADLRALIFSHQLDLPIARHRAEEGGRMLSRITYDTSMVGEAVSTAWLTIIRDTLVLIGLLGFLFYTAWQLTLLVLLIAPALAFAIRRINGRLRQSSERVQGWMGRVTGLVEEALLGLQEIKIFGAHNIQTDRFDKVNQGLRREQLRVVRVQAINVPLVQVLAACTVALVIYAASSLSRQDLLTPGEFVAFITAMSMIFEPVRRLTNVNAILQKGLAAAESVFNLLESSAEKRLVENIGTSTEIFLSAVPRDKGVESVQFDNVSYGHPNTNSLIIENFSLKISNTEKILVTGNSGSGKSTLLELFSGLIMPTSGKILIGGVPLKSETASLCRKKIAFVTQNPIIFNMSLYENVKLAKPNAAHDEVMAAIESAHLLEVIKKKEGGYNAAAGKLGGRLSGGERQRLAIARAYLKDAPILLMDEPVSALDSEMADQIYENLRVLALGRSTLLVTHGQPPNWDFSKVISFELGGVHVKSMNGKKC